MTERRQAAPTVKFVDEYCQWYQQLFPEVRSYEAFKYLHVGMISDIKRKSLPEIGKFVGLHNEQSLLHFVTESPWQVEDLREQRLKLILQVLRGREINLIIDETGDRKKGRRTDYVKRQYIGNLGKVENGIVADVLNTREHSPKEEISKSVLKKFSIHDWWNEGQGWKNLLNNLRLILQPFGFLNLIKPWLKVFSIPALSVGFERLVGLMNLFSGAVPIAVPEPAFLFSSA